MRLPAFLRRPAPVPAPTPGGPRVLVLTPVKDAADLLPGYFDRLEALTYPKALLSLGLLEGDSRDRTWPLLQREAARRREGFRRVGVWKRDFGFHLPPGTPRWAFDQQPRRRSVLARSRNHLLFRALDDEDWVLWLDADVIEYPADLIERLLASGKEIVQPHCVLEYGGPTFDKNGWRDHGRVYLDSLRHEEAARLDAVGGTALFVRADIHRDGLVFPPFFYGDRNPRARQEKEYIATDCYGEIETEGLGLLAADMGRECWGLPRLEILHRKH